MWIGFVRERLPAIVQDEDNSFPDASLRTGRTVYKSKVTLK